MKAFFTLTSAESRRLIAKAVVAMPEVQTALKKAYLMLPGGTTNAFIAEEITGKKFEPGKGTFGISTDGMLCVTHKDSRELFPSVYFKGKPVDKTLADAFNDYYDETVVIKGANAVDMDGYVGVITGGFDGGTIPRICGTITSKGLKFITPVGLEKLVPSVKEAANAIGARHIDISMGCDCGMFIIGNSEIVTEIQAIKILFDCKATLVCAGGVGGNEGAVTLAVDGEEKNVKAMVEYLEKNVKGEPPVKGNKGICSDCPYKRCRYNGLTKSKLPKWMKKKGIEK